MNLKFNKVFRIGLNIFAFGLLCLAIFYWVRMISQNHWDELSMRIILMVLMIGSVCCFSLAKIIKNQDQILNHLKHRQDKNDI